MTVKELIKLSKIEESQGFQTFDYAVPMNRDGSYPHNGRAIAVYYMGMIFPELVTYAKLAHMAMDNLGRMSENPLLDELKKIVIFNIKEMEKS